MIKALHLLILLVLICPPVNSANRNELVGHSSPYLAMHADDPVYWQPWGLQPLEQARREDKLILLSSGYFSCHWCHVMQRESYRNPKIAKLLNEAYIPVKVDRELEPVLDEQLMQFVQHTRGQGGWPLNVFLTPEGYPLLAVLYLPSDQFQDLLVNLDQRWKQERKALKQVAANAARLMTRRQAAEQRQTVDTEVDDLEQRLLEQTMLVADELAGGFGQQTKFPMVPRLSALLTLYQKYPAERLKDFLLLTLRQMTKNGLRDQLAGGFYRYTVDPQWKVPHFEKMLYDNAQLVELYLNAADVFSEPEFEQVAYDTLDFMLSDMIAPGGAFVAALSAVDEEGKEGGYYLWTSAELTHVLSDREYELASLAWGFGDYPDTQGGYLPIESLSPAQIAKRTGQTEAEVVKGLAASRQKLLSIRKSRRLPKDTKRLTAWNGLALSALAQAASRTPQRYRGAALELRNFMVSKGWSEEALARAIDDHGQSVGLGTLTDYAYVAKGLHEWAKFTNKQADYDLAARLVAEAWQRFNTHQGWQMAEASLIPAQPPRYHIIDGVQPSASATLLAISLELLHQPRLAIHRARIQKYLELMSQDLATRPLLHATHVAVLSTYLRSSAEK